MSFQNIEMTSTAVEAEWKILIANFICFDDLYPVAIYLYIKLIEWCHRLDIECKLDQVA